MLSVGERVERSREAAQKRPEPSVRTPRERILQRLEELRKDRDSKGWREHRIECSDYILPRRSRYLNRDLPNQGDKRMSRIIDTTATLAVRTLSAGMTSGLTSPARPWFRLTTADPGLAESRLVKAWLSETAKRMMHVLQKAGFYNVAAASYENLGVFGDAVGFGWSSFKEGMRFQSCPVGTYFLAQSYEGHVDTIFREFWMTAHQLVEQFGMDAVSEVVRKAYQAGSVEYFEVVHCVQPNDDVMVGALGQRGMAWSSLWLEKRSKGADFLRVGGFESQPFFAPRWWVEDDSVYGRSPGMEALPDVKQLQFQSRKRLRAVEKMVDPTIAAPTDMRQHERLIREAGGVVYTDHPDSVRPIYELQYQLMELDKNMDEVRQRIKQGFFVDLFLLISNIERTGVTATEIAQKQEEKLLQLGPVLERMEQEMHAPVIDRTFDLMAQREILPQPIPHELEDAELKVEYVSVLAQAQRQVGVTNMDRFMAMVQTASAVDPDVLDRFDGDQWIEIAADKLGIEPQVIRSMDATLVMREARKRAEMMANMAKMAPDVGRGAKDLSQANMQGENALTRSLDLLQQRQQAQGLAEGQ